MALCATTALAGAVSRLCVRGAHGRFGGGSGRYLVLCLSCFPLPAPRVPRCVWRAVLSGCPLPSLAGTPFHAVCAFRALGSVAPPVVPACPFRVCALALSRCPLPPLLGGVARASRPACPGCGRCGRVDPAPAPRRAPLRAGIVRCGGGGRASPGGVPSAVVGGAWCQALSLPRPPVLRSGQPGFRDPCVPGGSMRACGPSTGPTACALAGRRCSPLGWRKGVPRGGAFHRCEGRLVSGAVPPPAARPLEQAAGVPRPVCPGCGRCGRVDPAPAPLRAPLRAGVARCGGGGRASPGGGAFHRVVRGAWCQAPSLPRPPVLWSGRPGFRDPCVPGAVEAGV